MVHDTNSAKQLLSDEEIAFYYAQEGNVWRAAASCCLALIDGQSVDKTVGDLSLRTGSRLANYQALAKEYRMRANLGATVYAGGISSADKQTQEQDTDRVLPVFTKTLQGDPEITPGSTASST